MKLMSQADFVFWSPEQHFDLKTNDVTAKLRKDKCTCSQSEHDQLFVQN